MPPLADQLPRYNRNLALACAGWAFGSILFLLLARACFYGAQVGGLPTHVLGGIAALGAVAWLPVSGLWLLSAVLDHREFRSQLKATERLDLAIRRRLIKKTQPLLEASYINLGLGGFIWYSGSSQLKILFSLLHDLGINATLSLPVVAILGVLTWLAASIYLTMALLATRRHLRKTSSVTFTQLVRLTHFR
jgi:hypothetical protein